MIRILIVDDEHHIVNWLYELFAAKDDSEYEVLKAYSGYEAMQILKDYKINLILLDITMPGMSGLDVAQRALAQWPDLYIIFLTAHNSFDYIYQSNHLPHTSYLLKTEPDATIVATVQRSLKTIAGEQEVHDKLQTSEAKELLIDHLTHQEVLHIFLQGTHPLTSSEIHTLRLHKIPVCFAENVYLLYTQFPDSLFHTGSSGTSEKILSNLLLFTKKFVNERFRFTMLELQNNCYLWLFEENNEQNSGLDMDMSPTTFLKNLSEAMLSNVGNMTNRWMVNILYLPSVSSIDIRDRISRICPAAQELIRTNPKKVSYCTLLTNDDLPKGPTSAIPCSCQESLNTEDLNVFLTKKDKKSYLALLSDFCNRYSATSSMHDLNTIQVYNTISIFLIRYLNQHNLEKEIALKIAVYPLYYLQDFTTWKEAFQYLYTFSEYLFDLISSTEMDRSELLLSKIERYILDHIASPLTLSEIASSVNYNATYISRLYKKFRGIPLPKFILQSRISLAKNLLTGTDKSIQDIACETGFDTSQYFSIVFKRETGITPRDFRRNAR